VRLFLTRIGLLNATSPVVAFAKQRMTARLEATDAATDAPTPQATKRDFLTRFLEAQQKDPEFMHDGRVLALTTANMFAGSDTTAITLRAIFYFLLRNPDKLHKLLDELHREESVGHLSSSSSNCPSVLVKWREVQDLPYLSAVIKESLRCHPAAGLPLERVVPPRGIHVCGHYLPGGTIVGCSAWTVHRDAQVFGPEPGEFRPERWLEEATEAQRGKMANYLFSFGAGARTCVGRNISFLEMYKLVPALLRTFEVSFAFFFSLHPFVIEYTRRQNRLELSISLYTDFACRAGQGVGVNECLVCEAE
jgi:cytochrome P450